MPLSAEELDVVANLETNPYFNDMDRMVLTSFRDTDELDHFPEGYVDKILAKRIEEAQLEESKQTKGRELRSSRTPTTDTPYNSVLLDKTILDLLGDKDVVIADDAHALKSVALVGVLLPDTDLVRDGVMHVDELWKDDRDMIVNVAKNFSSAGIPIHPQAKFHIYNLLPPVSSDFLVSAHPCKEDMDIDFPDADLVCISYILGKYGARPGSRDYDVSRGFPELSYKSLLDINNCSLYTSVSGLHDMPNAWSEASFNLNAKFIAVRGGTYDEITTLDLQDHEDATVLVCSAENEKKKKPPSYNIGYVVRTSALPEYQDHATDENSLGQAIQNALG